MQDLTLGLVRKPGQHEGIHWIDLGQYPEGFGEVTRLPGSWKLTFRLLSKLAAVHLRQEEYLTDLRIDIRIFYEFSLTMLPSVILVREALEEYANESIIN